MARVILAVFAAVAVFPVAWQAFAGEAAPAWYEVNYFETRPGVFFYMFQDDALWQSGALSALRRATSDCVTPPVALEFSFPAVEGPPGFVELDLDQALSRQGQSPIIPPDAVGISFFFKGDGSKNTARIELRDSYRAAGAAFELPLGDTKWRHVLVKWGDFSPESDAAKASALGFGLKEGSSRPASYIVDALRFVKSAEADPAADALLEKANSLKILTPRPQRVSAASCVHGRAGLAKARAKLREGKGLKWLAYGDSITVPVQMWNVPGELQRKYAYYGAAAATLEKEFGGRIEVAVDAVGGRQLNENFESLGSSLEKEKPDVLVLFSGDTIKNYERLMPEVVKAAGSTGTEILVVIPTYDLSPFDHPPFEWLRKYCAEKGLACADARTYLLCTGEAYWGENISNEQHPNPEGHHLIGEVVAEMLR